MELRRCLDGRTGKENYSRWAQNKLRDIKSEVKKITAAKTKSAVLQISLAKALDTTERLNKELSNLLEKLVRSRTHLILIDTTQNFGCITLGGAKNSLSNNA